MTEPERMSEADALRDLIALMRCFEREDTDGVDHLIANCPDPAMLVVGACGVMSAVLDGFCAHEGTSREEALGRWLAIADLAGAEGPDPMEEKSS